MHARHLLIALVFQLAFCSIAISQSKRVSNVYLTEKFSHYTNPDASLSHENYFTNMSGTMGLESPSDMVLEEEIRGANGFSHYRYQQYRKGIPIFGNTYILHEKDGKVVSASGHYSPHSDLDLTPDVSAEKAMKLAKFAMKAKTYSSSEMVPTLCLIDPAFPKTSEELRLAYQIDLYSLSPLDKKRYFVDANHGEVISHLPLIMHEGVPSTAQTKYYGTQNITTDSLAPGMFVLRDPTRGSGITILDPDGNNFTSTSSNWDLENDLKDEVALDAHYCTERYYDMMLGKFNRNSLDDNGVELIINVHNNGAGNVNAFWDGVSSNYGDGDCIRGPLTTLEVIGHEFTHGMIDYTSQLVYAEEPGAINESLADMFGKALEYYEDPGNFNWALGHSFLLSPDGEPFRVLDDPESVGMPSYYKGSTWVDGADVHTNSSIGNLWFVMLVDGRQGTNEGGVDFDVPAIGMDKAIQIAYLSNKAYLTENSDYNDFYQVSLQAAEELYGPGAAEVLAVGEAWKAVGLPNAGTGGPSFDLSAIQPFAFVRSCVLNEFIPISFDITNVGTEPYYPSTFGIIFLSEFKLPNYSVTLTDTILAGEVLTITVDSWLISTVAANFNIAINLEVNDDNEDNNFSNLFYRINEHQSSDMMLDVTLTQPDCFSPILETVFSIRNNSCDSLLAGTPVTLSIKNNNGDVLWSEGYELTTDLAANQRERVFYDLDLGVTSSEELTFKLEYGIDPNPDNNETIKLAPILEIIDSDYLNEFSGSIAMDYTLDYESRTSNPIANYQMKTYFGSTGIFNDTEQFTACPNFEDNFDGSGLSDGITSTIRTCVDFSAYATPLLSFDLIQFTNEYADAEGYLYSCMLQAAWEGNEDGGEIIFGQEEGELIHHDFDLPAFFKGEVEFKFYTEIGQTSLVPILFPNDDVLLLDNLQFQPDFTGTTELENGSAIQVSPNPAKGLLSVRSEDLLGAVEIRHINGQLLKKETVRSASFDLDISGLGNGVYLLRLQNADGAWAVKKVVKL